MQWSQLKQRFESMLAPALQGRVQFWATMYRKPWTDEGRVWITLDGVEIYGMSDRKGNAGHAGENVALARVRAEPEVHGDFVQQPEALLRAYDLRCAMECHLRTPFQKLLDSDFPPERGLAMLDRRLGKRRFLALRELEREHPFTQGMYRLRGQLEGWLKAHSE